jgi:hypothetical protein
MLSLRPGVTQVRALTDARDALAQELSAARGGRQSAEAALTVERERVVLLESEKVIGALG